MDSTLRKTIIKIEDGIELLFWKLIKVHKLGCKAMFERVDTGAVFDVTVLSKNMLQMNNFSENILTNINRYQHMNSNIVCPIFSITEDSECIYIISEVTNYRLSDLVHKREGLTEFEIVYFLLDLLGIINYLKSRNSFYQILDIDEIYLTQNMKISIPFSIWIAPLNSQKPILLRHEDKKAHLCPQILKYGSISINADQINCWNIGVFLYELSQGKKPFQGKSFDYNEIIFHQNISEQLESFIRKVLKKSPQERTKFNLILVDKLLKKYKSLPHMLPTTIFSCPPSTEYISEYSQKFEEKNEENFVQKNKDINIKTVFQFQNITLQKQLKVPIKSFKSFKYLKPSQWNLTQTLYFVSEFVDISHSYGYGYQMNSGIVCFVFNDGTEMSLQNGQKSVNFTNQKKVSTFLKLDNLSQQGQIKKKLHILQAYAKSIKKFRPYITQNGKNVLVRQYLKTNCAAIFMLTNQSIQLIFADKMAILMSKKSIYINTKNLQKFQLYEDMVQTNDMSLRRKYGLTMAKKLFHWDIQHFQHKDIESFEDINE